MERWKKEIEKKLFIKNNRPILIQKNNIFAYKKIHANSLF